MTADRVLIVDYKTNRPPFLDAESVPARLQGPARDLSGGAARRFIPARRIEAALVFTEAPVLVPLDAATLEAALAALTPT